VTESYRDVEEITAKRNLSVDHVTIWRWVQRYATVWRIGEFGASSVRRTGPFAWTRPTSRSLVGGETVEFMLSPKRDLIAAKLLSAAHQGRASSTPMATQPCQCNYRLEADR